MATTRKSRYLSSIAPTSILAVCSMARGRSSDPEIDLPSRRRSRSVRVVSDIDIDV